MSSRELVTSRLRLLLQRLAVVVAAVALLGHGGVELAPRLIAGGASVAAASAGTPTVGRPAASRPAAESQPAERGATLRAALAVVVPTGSADPVAGPGSVLRVAPHLVARPVVRPPTPSYVLGVGGGASGRAPPAPAGT